MKNGKGDRMKKFLILAALVAAPLVAAGCSCGKYNANDNLVTTIPYNPNPVCPPPAMPCPPMINCTPAPQQQVMYRPAPVSTCPLPNNACAPVAPLAPLPQAVAQPYMPGRISYMEPVQVSGANSVQYYNPYAVMGGTQRIY